MFQKSILLNRTVKSASKPKDASQMRARRRPAADANPRAILPLPGCVRMILKNKCIQQQRTEVSSPASGSSLSHTQNTEKRKQITHLSVAQTLRTFHCRSISLFILILHLRFPDYNFPRSKHLYPQSVNFSRALVNCNPLKHNLQNSISYK